MAGKLICIADYLSYEEGILLYNALQEAEIPALVKSCGPPSIPFGEGLYYQLLIPEEDSEKAAEITENFKLQFRETKQLIRCPRCNSEIVLRIPQKAFFQKLFYFGTELYRCPDCKRTFFT